MKHIIDIIYGGFKNINELFNRKQMIQRLSLFGILALFLIYEMALQIFPSIIANNLMSALNISAFSLGIISAGFFVSYTFMQIPVGVIYDHKGFKVAVLMAMLTCSIGAAIFSIAHTVFLAVIARVFMGFGGAFAFVGTLLVASHCFSLRYFSFFAGLTQFIAAMGPLIGQLVLAHYVNADTWRIFSFSLALFGLCLVMLFSLFRLRNVSLHKKNFEKGETIMTNLKYIFKRRQSWTIAFYAMFLWAPMSVFASLWGIPYLQLCYGFSKIVAANLCSFMWLGIAVGSPLLGWLMGRFSRDSLFFKLCPLLGILASFSLWFGVGTNILTVTCLVFLLGLACSGQALSFSIIKKTTDHKYLSSAFGFNNMAIVISGLIFQPLVGKIVDFFSIGAASELTAPALQRAIFILPLFFIIAQLLSFLFKSSPVDQSYQKQPVLC